MKINLDRKSIKIKLITAFVITSIIPILLVNIIYFYNTSKLVRQNIESMTRANLEQTKVSLDVWLDSYEDILFQVYTDDYIVELVDKINDGEDVANNRKLLRKTLRGLFYTKDYVKSISIITESRELVFYDQLTASTTQTSWLDSIALSQTELYEEISGDNKTHLFPTGEKVIFGSNSCYLFHMGHRIIDYRNVQKKCGIVIVSIDVKLLEEVCGPPTESGLNFIVDNSGYLVSCLNSSLVGKDIVAECMNEEEKTAVYQQIAGETELLENRELSIYSVHDEKTGWEIIRATDQGELVRGLRVQQKILGFIIFLSLLAVLLIMVSQVTRMTDSIKRVVETMRKAGKGDLTVHVVQDEARPTEIEIIAEEFNSMMDKLKQSIEKQKNAEITALEAQINPHFLYNTLSAINWMAIRSNQKEISKVTLALSTFYRTALSKGEDMVTVENCIRNVEAYLEIQLVMHDHDFTVQWETDPSIKNEMVPKLLLQPVVENALEHGLDVKEEGEKIMKLSIVDEGEEFLMAVTDNGPGMDPEKAQTLVTYQAKGYGLKNVNDRIRLLYGEEYGVRIISHPGEGTRVEIRLPKKTAAEREHRR